MTALDLATIRTRALAALIPPPRLRLSTWIEANIRLPEGVSALPGAEPSPRSSSAPSTARPWSVSTKRRCRLIALDQTAHHHILRHGVGNACLLPIGVRGEAKKQEALGHGEGGAGLRIVLRKSEGLHSGIVVMPIAQDSTISASIVALSFEPMQFDRESLSAQQNCGC